MLGALWLYLSQSYEQVLIGRFVVGVGVAVSGVADVSYLHECAPIEWRGSIVSVNEACISLGFLLAYIAGYVYSSSDDEEWRIIFGWAGLLAAVQFIGMIRLPESPAWLSEKGKVEEARKAWQQINNTQGNNPNNDTISPVLRESEIDQTTAHSSDGIIRPPPPPTLTSNGFAVSGLANIGDQVGGDEETYQHPKNEIYDGNSVPSLPPRDGSILSKVNYWCKEIGTTIQSAMIILSRYRRQVYVALFLATTQQFCGQTIVLNYAPMIFAEAAKKDIEDGKIDEGDDGTVPDWSTVAIGLVKFIVTVLVIWRIEFVGRRILLIAGTSLIAMGLLALIVAFGGSTYFSNNNGVTDEDSAWSPLTNLKTFHLALPGVLLVVCGYSMSFGPLTVSPSSVGFRIVHFSLFLKG
jgi:MFS family permease